MIQHSYRFFFFFFDFIAKRLGVSKSKFTDNLRMPDNHEINHLRRVTLLLALLPLVVSTEPCCFFLLDSAVRRCGSSGTLVRLPQVIAVEHDLTKHTHEWQRERCFIWLHQKLTARSVFFPPIPPLLHSFPAISPHFPPMRLCCNFSGIYYCRCFAV